VENARWNGEDRSGSWIVYEAEAGLRGTAVGNDAFPAMFGVMLLQMPCATKTNEGWVRRLTRHTHLVLGTLGVEHGKEHISITVALDIVGSEYFSQARRGYLQMN